MFQTTRITLTIWYVIIACFITGGFSYLSYTGSGFEFERGLQRQQVITERNLSLPGQYYQFTLRPDPQLLAEVRQRLLLRMILIDTLVIFFAAIAGYFLAGKTLRPIQHMVDEQHRFIADASHELNTPLTVLRTEIEVHLRDPHFTVPKAKALLKSNLEDVQRLQTLSDTLLHLTQVESASTHVVFTTLVLSKIVQTAIQNVTVLAEEKHILISTKMPLLRVKGNEKSLIELFVILLDNAIKYSPQKATIVVSGEVIDKKIHATVKDSGYGIAAKELPHIFDRFYRVDTSRSQQNVSGYGLGLAIARHIVSMHHGKISVHSEVGKGTTFTILLPKNV